MKQIISKLWNYSPAQVVSILRNKIAPPRLIPEFQLDPVELARLQKLPRHQATETVLMGKKLKIVDAESYLAMCDEIFFKQNYKFIADNDTPEILDCGSNIGLSVIFFKMLYPKSKIIAFEPDGPAFAALEENMKNFNFTDVTLHRSAVWTSDGKINFLPDGSWGGKIIDETAGTSIVAVDAVRLKNFLDRPIDFLKIDIEGAESEVINDCSDRLVNVRNIFIEYHSSVGNKQTLHELLAALSGSGLRYHLKEAASRKEPFMKQPNSGFDSQLDIFAYRQ